MKVRFKQMKCYFVNNCLQNSLYTNGSIVFVITLLLFFLFLCFVYDLFAVFKFGGAYLRAYFYMISWNLWISKTFNSIEVVKYNSCFIYTYVLLRMNMLNFIIFKFKISFYIHYWSIINDNSLFKHKFEYYKLV